MISAEDLEKIEQQLGRKPRGVKEIVCYNKEGWPRVIRVTPVVEGKPFPSHYWLSCQILKKEIDHLEADGWVKKIENEYMTQEEFKSKVLEDHKSYIADRMMYLEQDGLLEGLDEKYVENLKNRGVGGIQDLSRVRCLHMHYAHHLAHGNTIGKLLDDLFNLNEL